MWGAKANRIADLEARLAVAQRNRQPIDDGSHDTIRALRDQLAKTKRDLRDTETQLGAARRRLAHTTGAIAEKDRQHHQTMLANTDLAYLIAEHLALGTSVEHLRKRVAQLGHDEHIDAIARYLTPTTKPAEVTA